MSDKEFSGFDELQELINEYAKKSSDEEVMKALESGAEEFVKILLKLPKPRSQIKTQGYVHLIDTFSHRKNRGQVEVGWGKYYGPVIEKRRHPHMKTSFEKNKEYIYKKMLNEAWKGI